MLSNKVESIKQHLEAIMQILGIEKNNSNENTPLRVAKMWVNELFKNRNNHNLDELDDVMKVFDNVDKCSDMVIIKDIEFHSVCEHHWLPFSGKVNVAYIPRDHIIGLSKIPRVVKYFSQKPQLQERLTQEIKEYLTKVIDPLFLVVEITATHDCVMCRGVESNCSTNTLSSSGNASFFMQDYFMRTKGVIYETETCI